MSVKLSTGHANHVLSGGSVKSLYDPGSEIRIYAGAIPADADDAIGAATLLGTIKNGSAGITFDAAAVGGVLQKNPGETWGCTPVATGAPSFYRHVLTADGGGASTTAPRYQGTVGVGGGDMNLTQSTLTTGVPMTLTYHAFVQPKA